MTVNEELDALDEEITVIVLNRLTGQYSYYQRLNHAGINASWLINLYNI